MRIFQPISAITGALFLLATDATTEGVENMAEQPIAKYGWEGSTTLQRVLQDRVSGVDSDGLSCVVGTPSSTEVASKFTTIQYYYAIESSQIISNTEVQELANSLFRMVSSSILWCTSVTETSSAIDAIIPPIRKLALMQQYPELARFTENHSSLSLEEARRLAIMSITSSPLDQIVQGLNCPYEFTDHCVVLEGKVKIFSHKSDNLALVVASILDASQYLMENDILLNDTATPVSVTKVQWLGETLEEAIAFGTDTDDDDGGGVLSGDVVPGVVPIVVPEANEDENSDSSNGITTIFAVSVPLIVLLGFAFLMNKIRKQRTVMIPVELDTGDQGVLVGTGDPPRSFHKGLYHYTRDGSRYLSTNCCLCAETRMSKFFNDGDLPTITEGRRLYGVHYTSSQGESCDDFSLDLEEPEPAMRLLSPNSKDLGGIHSGIDVHQCTSATCNICKFRGDEVTFLSSPKKENNSNTSEAWPEEDDIIRDNDDGLGKGARREEDDTIRDNDDGLGKAWREQDDIISDTEDGLGNTWRVEDVIPCDNDDGLGKACEEDDIICDNDDGLGERCFV